MTTLTTSPTKVFRTITLPVLRIANGGKFWHLAGGTLSVRGEFSDTDGKLQLGLQEWKIAVNMPLALLLRHDVFAFSSSRFSGECIVAGAGFRGLRELAGFSWLD